MYINFTHCFPYRGWMAPSTITREGLEETITLCRDYLGVETVVIMTINFTNDVHNPAEWTWASNMNSIIRELAQVFNKNATAHGSNFHIQIMEISQHKFIGPMHVRSLVVLGYHMSIRILTNQTYQYKIMIKKRRHNSYSIASSHGTFRINILSQYRQFAAK